MASSPQCGAVASAMKKQGLNYAGLAAKIGSTPQRVEEICTAKVHPTAEEFGKLARALNMQGTPGGPAHRTS
ncbi:hypothetical protein BKA83DRAFT_4245865 [Pisolithus microcarpus]|nr:hypothetical protein BKA83DRAFT_4245865 [Pisolithus microcarpus]